MRPDKKSATAIPSTGEREGGRKRKGREGMGGGRGTRRRERRGRGVEGGRWRGGEEGEEMGKGGEGEWWRDGERRRAELQIHSHRKYISLPCV